MSERIERVLRFLRKNNFDCESAENSDVAKKIILGMIPEGSTVGIGDSATVRQIGIIKELKSKGVNVVNPFSREITMMVMDLKKRKAMLERALYCDVFLTGTNAVTQDGKLVNTDSAGNRIVGMIFGPNRVIIVVGRNKIVKSVNEAFHRIKNTIAPVHAKTKGFKVPCVHAGKCVDCYSEDRICNVSSVLEKKPRFTSVTVIIVNEDLGLSWDKSWSQSRINRILNRYRDATWGRWQTKES